MGPTWSFLIAENNHIEQAICFFSSCPGGARCWVSFFMFLLCNQPGFLCGVVQEAGCPRSANNERISFEPKRVLAAWSARLDSIYTFSSVAASWKAKPPLNTSEYIRSFRKQAGRIVWLVLFYIAVCLLCKLDCTYNYRPKKTEHPNAAPIARWKYIRSSNIWMFPKIVIPPNHPF